MEIESKTYKRDNTKTYLKTNNLFFIFNGVNQSSIDRLLIDQNIKNTNFKYQKMENKIVNVAIKKSIYCNINSVIAGVLFFIKPNLRSQVLYKKIILNKFETFFFFLSAAKLNNNLYSIKIIQNMSFLDYSDNNLLFFQSVLVNLKFCSQTLKKSK